MLQAFNSTGQHKLQDAVNDAGDASEVYADNASVNYGKHHSIFTSLNTIQARLKANCNCHVLHNAAKYACKQLTYDVEQLVVKVYNEFSVS